MNTIDSIEEFDRDWDWFAVDPDGMIGHFTTAGMRPLPKAVKQDRNAAMRLIKYFVEEAPESTPYSVRFEAEKDSGGWRDEAGRQRYLKDYAKMASVGLYSYDTPTSGATTNYFLVASPKHSLKFDQLPPEIRDLVTRTKSPYPFSASPYISAVETETW
jgi:hypothetical protein